MCRGFCAVPVTKELPGQWLSNHHVKFLVKEKINSWSFSFSKTVFSYRYKLVFKGMHPTKRSEGLLMCGQTATASSFKYPQLILRQNSRSLGISTYAPLYRWFDIIKIHRIRWLGSISNAQKNLTIWSFKLNDFNCVFFPKWITGWYKFLQFQKLLFH